MNNTNELELARLRKRRKLLSDAERWTPQEALEAALADIRLGELEGVEVVTVVVSRTYMDGDDRMSYVEQYCGTNGATGPKDTFWIVGMIQRAIIQWIGH